jgi:hypothetical protein
MPPESLTHFDRIVILLAVAGGVVFALLPVIVVLIAPEKPRSEK